MSLLFVGLALTQHLWTAMLLLALIGFIDGTTDVLFDTIVQREADSRYYGRVFGLASAFFTTTMMGAVAAAPLVNRLADAHRVILFAALGLLVAGVGALLGSGLVRGRTAPAATDPIVSPEVAPVLELVPRLPGTAEAPARPVRVVVRLSDGSLVAVERCASRDEAEQCARDAVRSLDALQPGEWPYFGGRFLRPDAILSFELVEEFVIELPGVEAGPDDLPKPGVAYDR
jgi:MFS family permease